MANFPLAILLEIIRFRICMSAEHDRNLTLLARIFDSVKSCRRGSYARNKVTRYLCLPQTSFLPDALSRNELKKGEKRNIREGSRKEQTMVNGLRGKKVRASC